MSELRFPTSLGMSTTSTITLLGDDLAGDLMGKVGLTELVYRMVTLRTPTPGQVRMLDACLLALADHGFTPTAIAARLTFLSAPDSVQGAMAAGLLGGGSRFLGVTEDCGQFLHAVVADLDEQPDDEAGWDEVARGVVSAARAERRTIPGLGHPVHKELDPRTPALVGIAREEECTGRTSRSSRRSVACTPRSSVGVSCSTAPASWGGARRPRPAPAAPARVRPAGPRGRTAGPARGGAAQPDRHGRLPRRGAQRRLRQPRGRARRPGGCGRGALVVSETVDVGLLVLRVGLGALLLGHALQKSLGWFGGAGIDATAGVFESWGFRPGRRLVALAAASEVVAAVLLVGGLGFGLGCAILVGTMVVAAAPTAANGIWAHLGGCEVPLLYGFLGACLALTGPGRLSLDHALGVPDGGAVAGPLLVLLGCAAAVPPLLQRRRALRATRPVA
ncbi:citryl-CoA lyase [Nocardioides zeae]